MKRLTKRAIINFLKEQQISPSNYRLFNAKEGQDFCDRCGNYLFYLTYDGGFLYQQMHPDFGPVILEEKLSSFLAEYGLHYELNNSWSLCIYRD